MVDKDRGLVLRALIRRQQEENRRRRAERNRADLRARLGNFLRRRGILIASVLIAFLLVFLPMETPWDKVWDGIIDRIEAWVEEE